MQKANVAQPNKVRRFIDVLWSEWIIVKV